MGGPDTPPQQVASWPDGLLSAIMQPNAGEVAACEAAVSPAKMRRMPKLPRPPRGDSRVQKQAKRPKPEKPRKETGVLRAMMVFAPVGVQQAAPPPPHAPDNMDLVLLNIPPVAGDAADSIIRSAAPDVSLLLVELQAMDANITPTSEADDDLLRVFFDLE